MTTADPPVTSRDILAALTGHYRQPGAVFDGEILIPEVQAPGSQRRADLVRVGMWQSRGTGIDVHEIKVSRADWLRELGDPGKAEAWWPYCNRFWLVTPPGVVKAATELPPGWGLLELPAGGRRRMKVRVRAETRKDTRLTVPLIIELLRRADNQRIAQIRGLENEHRNQMYRAEQAWRTRKAEGEIPWDLRQRLELLKQIETILGMPLTEYGDWPHYPPEKIAPEELAAFLADVREHVTVQRRMKDLTRQHRQLRDAADGVLRALHRAGEET